MHQLPGFISSAGFWISYGAIIQPTNQIAAAFAPASDASNGITAAAAGAATRGYNAGLGMYFLVWGIIVTIYFIASLRTYANPFRLPTPRLLIPFVGMRLLPFSFLVREAVLAFRR